MVRLESDVVVIFLCRGMDQYIWRKEDINVLEVIISRALCVGGGTHDEQY